MATNPIESGILKVCREHIDQFRNAIELMEAGKMGTGDFANGTRTDTTAATIDWYKTLIVDLERTVSMIEAAKKAVGPT